MRPVLLAVCVLLNVAAATKARTIYCGGKEMLQCPSDSFCIDLPDNCHPQLGDKFCPGVCYEPGFHTTHSQLTHTLPSATSNEVFSCGGKDHRACPSGYHCVDLPDKCFPEHGDRDCDGVCYELKSAAKPAAVKVQSKPVATHQIAHCGGPQSLVCPSNYVCVDLPDTCNPLSGDENCPGICYLSAVSSKHSRSNTVPLVTSSSAGISLPVPESSNGKISLCGVNNLKCSSGYTCVDLPDHCDPMQGGVNCPGVCYVSSAASSGSSTGTSVVLDNSQYSVHADLSAVTEYKSEAVQYCHNRVGWTHTKALWCCQHEHIGCPSPAYVLEQKGRPLGVSTVPKACLYNQCPAGTTTCVADPHTCKDKKKQCFQYKCEPVESNPLHKAQTAGCDMYKNCAVCTKKYNWQGEQCAWCMSTGKCAIQSSTLNTCQAGARLYANECPVPTQTGLHTIVSQTTTTKTVTTRAAKKAVHKNKAAEKSFIQVANATKKVTVKKLDVFNKTRGPVGPAGPRGPPGLVIESPNVQAAVRACKGKTPGQTACSFKLTNAKVISGICWHNKNTKDPSYCSAKFKSRVANWIASYTACKTDLAGATCHYKSNSGTAILGACVPHNFLGAPVNFTAFIENNMGKKSAKSFKDLQRDLFFDEEDEDHEHSDNDFNDEDESEEEDSDNTDKHEADMSAFLNSINSINKNQLRRKARNLLWSLKKEKAAAKKPARLFCASHTTSDVTLWNAAVRACSNKKVKSICGYHASPAVNKIGRCVNGNVGSFGKNAKKVRKLYCRPK